MKKNNNAKNKNLSTRPNDQPANQLTYEPSNQPTAAPPESQPAKTIYQLNLTRQKFLLNEIARLFFFIFYLCLVYF